MVVVTPGTMLDVTSAVQVYSPKSEDWKDVNSKGRAAGVGEVKFWVRATLPSGRIHEMLVVAPNATGVVTTQLVVNAAPTIGADGELVNMMLAGIAGVNNKEL